MKVDNIEYYTLDVIKILQLEYGNLLEKTDGIDPDFPLLSFDKPKNNVKVDGKIKHDILDAKTKKIMDKLWR